MGARCRQIPAAFATLTLLATPAARADGPPPRGPQPETPARPRLPPAPPAAPVPWEPHLELGSDVAFVQRAASVDGNDRATDVRYRPGLGYGLHASWHLVRWLRFSGYFVDARHEVELPAGALGLTGVLTMDPVRAYSLGARLAPTLTLGERARAWLSLGIGWGRLEFDRMKVVESTASPFEVRERSQSFVEYPLGLGASFDVVPRWLSVEVGLSAAVVDDGDDGSALVDAQAIDAAGKRRNVGSLPQVDAAFVQSIGLSLLL